MTLTRIKQLIAEGKRVYWMNDGYEVVLDKVGQYLILCNLNDSCIGLTWTDGVTLNGKEQDFYVGA